MFDHSYVNLLFIAIGAWNAGHIYYFDQFSEVDRVHSSSLNFRDKFPMTISRFCSLKLIIVNFQHRCS